MDIIKILNESLEKKIDKLQTDTENVLDESTKQVFDTALKQWIKDHPPIDLSKPGATVPDDWEWE